MLLNQGVNQDLIGAGELPLPNLISQSLFPIEFMLTAQFIFFVFCSSQWSFHSQYFFGLFNQVPFLRIFTTFDVFYFWAFFLYVFIYRVVENRWTWRQLKIVFLLHNRSLHVCLLLFFKSPNKKSGGGSPKGEASESSDNFIYKTACFNEDYIYFFK